jgi:hypothetical protein
VVERDGNYFIFSPFFQRWIQKEILAAPGEEESENNAETWLKGGGHEDVKNAKSLLPRFKKQYWPLVGSYIKDLSIKVASSITVELLKSHP